MSHIVIPKGYSLMSWDPSEFHIYSLGDRFFQQLKWSAKDVLTRRVPRLADGLQGVLVVGEDDGLLLVGGGGHLSDIAQTLPRYLEVEY